MGLDKQPESENNLIIPLISNGVKCISIGSLVDSNQAGIWRGPMVTKILHQLIRGVNWRFDKKDVDVMIIDMPPGTGDVYLSLAEKFPIYGVILVSTPQNLTIIDVIKSIDCFEKLKIPILGIIENMSYFETNGKKMFLFGKDGVDELSKKRGIKILCKIPVLQEISDASQERKLIVLQDQKIADLFKEIKID